MRNLTRSSTLKILRVGLGIIIALAIIVYAIWRSQEFIRGPELVISEPSNGQPIPDQVVLIRGQAMRANSLSINGNDISIDKNGFWQDKILVFTGVNKISVEASDRFGKKTAQILTILGTYSRPVSPINESPSMQTADTQTAEPSSNSTSTTETSSASSTTPL